MAHFRVLTVGRYENRPCPDNYIYPGLLDAVYPEDEHSVIVTSEDYAGGAYATLKLPNGRMLTWWPAEEFFLIEPIEAFVT